MNRGRILLAIALISLQRVIFAEVNFQYQPFPVLLVHGFNATPFTFGAYTEKENQAKLHSKPAKFRNTLATKLLEKHFGPYDVKLFGGDNQENFSTDHTFFKLIDHFGLEPNKVAADNAFVNIINAKDFRFYNLTGIPDYLKKRSADPAVLPYEYSLYPAEEVGSYAGLNHTYVETYCGYDAYESNWGEGTGKAAVREPRYRGYGISSSDDPAGYDISKGGQTQLLRIRIIQMLNEYYGDFKWVGDPSAKINLVCHSNGGLVATYMLQTDDDYYHDGTNLKNVPWENFLGGRSNSADEVIDGYGVLLRDHVAKVLTVDSPLSGSPLATKEGKPNALLDYWLTSSAELTCSLLFGLAPNQPALAAIVCTAVEVLMNFVITPLIYDVAAGGADSPVMFCLAENGDFVNRLSSFSNPPLYSDNLTEIPYINIAATGNGLALSSNIAGTVFSAAGLVALLPATFCPGVSILSFYEAAWSYALGYWCITSDVVVPIASQDIKTLYPSAKSRKLIDKEDWKIGVTHSAMPRYSRGDIVKEIKPAFSFDFFAAIGDNTFTSASNSLPFTTITGAPGTGKNDGVLFEGLSKSTTDELKQWYRIDAAKKSFETNPDRGVPAFIVGKIQDYYMNRGKLEVKVNSYDWESGEFYNMKDNGTGGYTFINENKGDFGSISCRNVDSNGDGEITKDDGLDGAYFFAFANPEHFLRGANAVYLRYTDDEGKISEHTIPVHFEVERAVPYEVTEDGKQRIKNLILYQSIAWPANEASKEILFAFSAEPVQSTFTCDIHGSNPFTQGNPGPGTLGSNQYRFEEVVDPVDNPDNTKMLTLLRLSIGRDRLAKNADGTIATRQVLHMQTYKGSNKTEMHFPFVVDNESPSIAMYSPNLLLDYNRDGVVDDVNDDLNKDGHTDQDDEKELANDALAVYSESIAKLRTVDPDFDPSVSPWGDGVDNDMDGYIDEMDECDRLRVYSMKFDANGVFNGRVVNVHTHVTDNAQEYAGLGNELWHDIYKVAGDAYNPLNDKSPVFSTNRIQLPQLGTDYNGFWDFQKNKANPAAPPEYITDDGLYCVIMKCKDAAENMGHSLPGYFIVDTKNPAEGQTLKNWQDDNGALRLMNSKSTTFGFSYRPVPPTTKTDYEAERLEMQFFEVDADGKDINTTPHVFYAALKYQDNMHDDGTPGPDGKIDPVLFNLSADKANPSFTIHDGKFRTEVRAFDRAGNNTVISAPSNQIITVDREPPTVFEYSIEPVLVATQDRPIVLRAKINERYDAKSNWSGIFKTAFYLDDQTSPLPVSFTSLTAGTQPLDAPVTDIGSISIPVANHGAPGRHIITIKVSDQNGNSYSQPVSYFYKNLGAFISYPGADQVVDGNVVVYGNVVDPDATNDFPFDRYELALLDAVDRTPVSPNPFTSFNPLGSFSSTFPVSLNGKIGVIATSSLAEKTYIISIRIFEKNKATPTLLEQRIKVKHGAAIDPPITLTANIPATYQSGVYTCTYDIADAVCDVTMEIYNLAKDVVYRSIQPAVVPFKGLAALTESNANAFRFGILTSGLWRGEWGEEYSVVITCNGATIAPADVDASGNLYIATMPDKITLTAKPGEITSAAPAWFTVTAGKLSSRAFSIEVLSNGEAITANLIRTSSGNVAALNNPVTIQPGLAFEYDGKNPFAGPLDNGNYQVIISATSTLPSNQYAMVDGLMAVSGQDPLRVSLNPACTPTYIPETDGAGICYNVNKVSDIIIDVVSKVNTSEVLLRSVTIPGVIAAGSEPAFWTWDAVMADGREVQRGDNVEFRIHAVRALSGETSQTLISTLNFQDAFKRPPDNQDPIRISGGKTGQVTIVNGSSSITAQTASGIADAHVKTAFVGEKYEPIKVGYMVAIKHRSQVIVTADVKYETLVKYRGYVSISLKEGRGIGIKDNILGDLCETHSDNVFNGFMWNTGSWVNHFVGDGCANIKCPYICDKFKSDHLYWNNFSEPYAKFIYLPAHTNDPNMCDLSRNFRESPQFHVFPAFQAKVTDIVNEYLGTTIRNFTVVDAGNGKSKLIDDIQKADKGGMVIILGGIKYKAAITFYKEYPFNTNTVPKLSAGEEELTLNPNDPFQPCGYLGNSWVPFETLIPANQAAMIETFKKDIGWTNPDGSPRPFPEDVDAVATYSIMGINDLNYSTSDPLQSLLEIKPVVTFAGNKKIHLKPQKYRCHDQAMLPIGAPIGDTCAIPFENNKDVTMDGNKQPSPNAIFKTYTWDLNLDADDGSDASLVAALKDKNIKLLARPQADGKLHYQLADAAGNGLPDILIETIYNVTTTHDFSLSKNLPAPGYASADVPSTGAIEYNVLPDIGTSKDLLWDESIELRPFLILSNGAIDDATDVVTWHQADAKADGVFTIGINNTYARSRGFISSWNPISDDAILAANGGKLPFTVHRPDRYGAWPESKYRDAYLAELTELQRNGSTISSRAPLFFQNGSSNPDIDLTGIVSEVSNADGSVHLHAQAADQLIRDKYEDSRLSLSFRPAAEGTEYSNYIALQVAVNCEPTRAYFDIYAYQNRIGYPIAAGVDNHTYSVPGNKWYWNAGRHSGEMQFIIKYYNKDSQGLPVNEITYGQTAFIGYIVGKDAYGSGLNNHTALSPYSKVEIAYNDPAGSLPSFDRIQVSSATALSHSNLFVAGLGTQISIDQNAPLISVTPSPVKFQTEKRPTLYYRLLRAEIMNGNGSSKITRENLARLYHLDLKTGALNDITVGSIAAVDYDNPAGVPVKVFESDDPDFNSYLTNRPDWKYIEITGVPSEFGTFIPLLVGNTIGDRATLAAGEDVSRGQHLQIKGTFYRKLPIDPKSPQATDYRVLASFAQNLSDRSLQYARNIPGSILRSYPASENQAETPFTVDDIIVPSTMQPNDTIYIYAYPWNTTLGDNANFSVSVARYVVEPTSRPNSISPVLESVISNCDGTYTAYFGYNNKSTYPILVDTGSQNSFHGGSASYLGQPTTFLPGRHRNVFSVNVNGNNLVWSLTGRTSTANESASINHCVVEPILEYTENNCNGTFTAHFGYNNNNPVSISLPTGPANSFAGGSSNALGQPTNFLPGQHHDVFSIIFTGDDLIWTLDGFKVTANATASRNTCPVSPVLEGIQNSCDGTYVAQFGYNNPNKNPVSLEIGTNNKFTGGGDEFLGQPTVFEPGRKANVFSVKFSGANLVWTLNGRTSTANGSKATNRCPISPVLENIINNCDGSFTAYFGYKNPNMVPIEISTGERNLFVGGNAVVNGQPTVFEPGRHYSVFSASFDGTDLVWKLDGRTSTANGLKASTICAISPVLENIENNCDGTYVAYFGYNNPNKVTIAIAVGESNSFSGSTNTYLGQPTAFEPGRHANVFSIPFAGSDLVWALNGRTSTANGSKASNICPISPVLEKVENNCDGTYSAYFGYNNPNMLSIDVAAGDNNKFTGGDDHFLGQPVVFDPGRHQSVFKVIFNGGNLVWSLTQHTATANGSVAQNICSLLPIIPVLESVLYDCSTAKFSAQFGYLNPNAQAISIPVGMKNKFIGSQQNENLGQPTVFEPGRKEGVFSINLLEATSWVLDDSIVTATPSTSTNLCAISPVLENVFNNCNGTYTATFGYNNPNGLTVIIPTGEKNKFTGGISPDLGQPTSFKPGRQVAVFKITWPGTTNLVWKLNAKSSTAGAGAAKNSCTSN